MPAIAHLCYCVLTPTGYSWSVGPFFTDMEYVGACVKKMCTYNICFYRRHQDKIQNMLDDLEHLSGQVKSENMKRVKYFCGVIKRLRLIRVYGSIDAYVAADTGDSEKAYEALEKLRKQWRTQQMERVKKNLDDTQYTISDPEVVGLVVGQGRIEQVGILQDLPCYRATQKSSFSLSCA